MVASATQRCMTSPPRHAHCVGMANQPVVAGAFCSQKTGRLRASVANDRTIAGNSPAAIRESGAADAVGALRQDNISIALCCQRAFRVRKVCGCI